MFYFMFTDEHGIDCVDQVDEASQNEKTVCGLATQYTDTIYFVVETGIE